MFLSGVFRFLLDKLHEGTEEDTDECDSPLSTFESLPDVLVVDMCRWLSLMDAMAVCRASRTLAAAIRALCQERIMVQYDQVIRHFPDHIVDSVPKAVWFHVEWISWKPCWLGNTGYVDNVKPAELTGTPFKCCRDEYGRLALLMRRKRDVAVLFQRFSEDSNVWVFASRTLPIGGCRLSESMVARLALWLSHDYADYSFPSDADAP